MSKNKPISFVSDPENAKTVYIYDLCLRVATILAKSTWDTNSKLLKYLLPWKTCSALRLAAPLPPEQCFLITYIYICSWEACENSSLSLILCFKTTLLGGGGEWKWSTEQKKAKCPRTLGEYCMLALVVLCNKSIRQKFDWTIFTTKEVIHDQNFV